MKTLDIISFIVSVIALGLSILAFMNTTNFAVKEKQADAVMELLQYLGNTPMKITFADRNDSCCFYSYENYTLLELSYTNYYNKLDSANIFFDISDKLPVDLRDFSNNPYMPSSIAKVLTKYYSYKIALVSDSVEKSGNSIILRNYDYQHLLSMQRDSLRRQGKYITNQQQSVYQYYVMRNASAYINWAVFKETNMHLLDVIKKWLDKHNIDEVNIPTDHLEYEM